MSAQLDGWVRRTGVRVAVAVAGAAVLTGVSGEGAGAGEIPAWHLIALPLPPGSFSSTALVVADDGTAYGNVWFPDRPDGRRVAVPVKWPPGGGIVELPTAPEATATTVTGLDRRGMVVGSAVGEDGVARPVLWEHDRAVVLPSPGNSAWVGAGNRSGVHVGGFVGWDGKNHAARWDRAGRITALEQLPGAGGSSATDVDDTGLITGSADTASGGSRAATWDERGRLDVLPDLGGRYNWAGTIARSGKILGIADRPEQASCDCHNTVYWNRSGRLTDLGLPFGAKSTYPDGGMNDSGVVAGSAYSEVPGVPHAIRWDPRDRPADLGTLPGGSWSRALGINARGAVIGEAGTSDHATHAVYWNPAGQPEDLGALPGATWSSPAAVNDHDVVVGFSQDPQTFTGRAVEWRRW